MLNRRLLISFIVGLTLVATGILFKDSTLSEWPAMLHRNGAAILIALSGFGLIGYGFLSSEKALKIKKE